MGGQACETGNLLSKNTVSANGEIGSGSGSACGDWLELNNARRECVSDQNQEVGQHYK